MREIQEAQQMVLDEIAVLGRERLHILDALNRVLAQDVQAKRDVPMADNSAMDGYCCRHEDVKGANRSQPVVLRIVGDSPAGHPFAGEIKPGEAVRIMTGGLLPSGADTIVMVEDTEITGNGVVCFHDPGPGAHIRTRGEDVKAGEVVLKRGHIMRPPEVGMLATLGHAYVYVYQRALVAILSTGDELVDLDEAFDKSKVVCSNTYSLAAQVADCGAVPICLGIASDDEADQRGYLVDGLRADVIVTSGGVSVGKYDLVKDALTKLGMRVKFSKVAMKPGKPLLFGTIDNRPIFGLPGNPTSAMVTFEQFVRPALLKMMGHFRLFRPVIQATLVERVRLRLDRSHLARCRLVERNGEFQAVLIGPQGPGALRSMVPADGLIMLPPGPQALEAGERVKVQVLDPQIIFTET